MPTTLEIAKSLNTQIRAIVDAKLTELGVSVEKDAKEFYKTSREVTRAVVACATQRMFEDGARPSMVANTVSTNGGWDLFLELHPEILEKIKAEKEEAQLKALAFSKQQKGNSVLEDDDCEDCGCDPCECNSVGEDDDEDDDS